MQEGSCLWSSTSSFFEREEESTDEGYSSRLHYDRAAAGDTVWLMNDMAGVVSCFEVMAGADPWLS